MLNLKNLKVLILEQNNLLKLTTNSLDQNNPEIKYKVISKDKLSNSIIGTALSNIKETTLVIKSGLVLNLTNKDLPSKRKLNKYDICLSRQAVFIDHERIKVHYPYVKGKLHKKILDLSIFIINPNKWNNIPKQDKGIISGKKKLIMPRYMNHKDDVLFSEESTAAIDALHYGVLGEQASVYNYVNVIEKNEINVLETYAYCFDKLLPYIKGLPKKEKDRVKYLGNKTKIRISNTREKLHELRNL